MNGLTLVFEPLIASWLLAALGAGAAIAGLLAPKRGLILRLAAIGAVALAIANPSLVEEDREPLPDVALLIVDDSQSMTVGERETGAERAAQAVRDAADGDPTLELVEARVLGGADGTLMFDTVAQALGEAPRGRLAGVVMVTDGQAHDPPEAGADLDIDAPVHALVVGDRDAGDRRLIVQRAPAFGIVGDRVRFTLRVEDVGPNAATGEPARVELRRDGGEPLVATAIVGEDTDVEMPLERRGPNVVEIEVEAGPAELTLINNRAAVSVSGVRDRLRVLLITGEPHAGARAWRDLLKSDPSVDLVHFTILRPPERQDGTPENELSLIRFPTQELFEQQLENFDLIIFDRYRRRGVLRMLYLDNIARYVESGGALLIAAGPPFATSASLYRTPLSAVLPVRPTTDVVERGFRPAVTPSGRRHPVTSDFTLGEDSAQPEWGRWFRIIAATQISGEAVLEDAEHRPLLVLDRQGDGRVAMLLSDHSWLWSRGFEGGGPHGELFRRLSHWLMQEPELEEERLTAQSVDQEVRIARRTMGDAPEPAQITAPDGTEFTAPFRPDGPGAFVADLPADQIGLYRVRSGDLTTTAAAGPINPREFADLRPTSEPLDATLEATQGGAYFIGEGDGVRMPQIRRTRAGDVASGRGWLGLARNDAYIVRAQERRPLAPALLAVAIALTLLAGAWAREGR